METLHANAAHQQGILSAAVAILEMAAGSGSFDEQGQLQVTEDHVQAAVAVTSLFQFLNVAPSRFNSKGQRKRSPKTLCVSWILSRQMPSFPGA